MGPVKVRKFFAYLLTEQWYGAISTGVAIIFLPRWCQFVPEIVMHMQLALQFTKFGLVRILANKPRYKVFY